MKRNAIVAVAVLAATTTLAEDPNSVAKARVHDLLVSNTQGEAMAAMVLLNEIRAGRTNAALELLEFKIDSAVTAVAGEIDGAAGQGCMEFLSAVKAYRSKHPRRIEAEVYGPQESRESAVVTIEKAKQVLAGVK